MQAGTVESERGRILEWCHGIIGPFSLEHTGSNSHGRSSVMRLRTGASTCCYAKVHRHKAYWHQEVQAYRNWLRVLGASVPTLLDVHEEEPRAILMSAVAGRSVGNRILSMPEERKLWEDAGRALATLHSTAIGDFFGPCRADGRPSASPRVDAIEYVAAQLDAWAITAEMAAPLDGPAERAIKAAEERLPAFAGERPVPCHRDFGPANWLVNEDNRWVGVVDFEMAHWDVRMAELSRYPDWEWIRRPDLIEALLAGYGRSLTAAEHDQLYCTRVIFALSAVAWGTENRHQSFAEQGRQVLCHLAKMA